MDTTLPAPVRTYITAVNALDGDTLIAAFSDDAVVNDVRREFSGLDAIRGWLDREITGEKVTMNVTRFRTHHALVIVDAEMDGEYNKDGLQDQLVLTHYFTLADDHIAQLIIIANQPTPSWAQP
jgi:ketosteroid isomerase-like protein